MSKEFCCANCKFREGVDFPYCTNPGSQYYKKSVRGVRFCTFCQVHDEEAMKETLSKGYVHTETLIGNIVVAPVNFIIWIVKQVKKRKEKKEGNGIDAQITEDID